MRAAKDQHDKHAINIVINNHVINLNTVATETDLVTYFDKFSDSDVDFVMSWTGVRLFRVKKKQTKKWEKEVRLRVWAKIQDEQL